jgi:integrase
MVEGKIKRYFTENPHLTIGNITAKEIEKFYTYLFGFDVSANTVIHYHALMHRAFKQAFKDDLIAANPFDKVTRPKKNEFQGSFYSKEEMHRLLEVTKNDTIYPVILISGTMGLRRSEALGVRWSRIDWEARTVLLDTKIVEKKENGKKLAVPVEEMKNKASKRTMAIPDVTYEMLKE